MPSGKGVQCLNQVPIWKLGDALTSDPAYFPPRFLAPPSLTAGLSLVTEARYIASATLLAADGADLGYRVAPVASCRPGRA